MSSPLPRHTSRTGMSSTNCYSGSFSPYQNLLAASAYPSPIIECHAGDIDGSHDELYGARRGLDQTSDAATARNFVLTTNLFEDMQFQDRHV